MTRTPFSSVARHLLLAGSLFLTGLFANAQAQPVPAHLRPIERAVGSSALGSVYVYDGKKLHSSFSLEVPLLELNDPEVNRRFRRFRVWTTVSRLTALIPLVYLFSRANASNGNTAEYWTVSGGSLLLSFGTVVVANTQLNRGVSRYNTLLGQVPTGGQVRVGPAVAASPFGVPVVGVGGVYRFR